MERPVDPPEGYLGATARIRRGPAAEMVEAGYRLEIADAPLLHRGLALADLAHVLVLAERGVVPGEHEPPLLEALLTLAALPAEEFAYDPTYGDAYNARERWLEGRIGTAAGWLAAGRTRREAGRVAFRIALRARIIVLAEAVAGLAGALTEVAARHAGTVMADYTYLQIAQAATFGHYLLSFAYPALRDGDRLRDSYAWVNRSPGGAGGVAGTRLPVDRRRVALLLGFDGPIDHTRDAIWQTDGLVDLLCTVVTAATNVSRLAEDLEIYGSGEFGLVRIGDEFCRASVLMPQKRNPYALSVIRGGAGTLVGRATGLMVTQRTPSARTDNLLYAYGEVCRSVDLATGLVDLAAGVVRSVVPDTEAMARRAALGFSQATDLAEAITLHTGMDYRSSYRIVGRAVTRAIDEGAGPERIDPGALHRAAGELGLPSPQLTAGLVEDAMDPAAAIRARASSGGAAPESMALLVEDCRRRVRALASWARERGTAARLAEDALLDLARRRREAPDPGGGPPTRPA